MLVVSSMKEILSETNPATRATRIEYPESPRLRRIRRLAQLLDQSIVLPNGYRIGLDPLIGLIPVVGDFAGAAFSLYIVYESARLGIPKRILLRMCGNVLMELLVGEIPVLGDIFDAVWKANMRNLRLIELHHRPTEPERSLRQFFWAIALLFAAMAVISLATLAGMVWLLVQLLRS
jgi:hypothetical protein